MAEHDDEIASIFAAGGETGARMRQMEWSSTPLGRPETWPQSLRSALSICLGSRLPICLCWGADQILLYNDAWLAIFCGAHQGALCRTAAEAWPDIWHAIKPVFDAVIAKGEGVWVAGIFSPMRRQDDDQDRGFSCAVGPIRGEGGAVVGLFTAAIETTARVLADRDGAPAPPDRRPEPVSDGERTALLERLVTVQEEERLRIARELHDQMGQDLTGLSLGLKSLETALADETGRETLRWLLSLTAKIGSNVHRAAWELRPTSLDDVGLARALETYVADWSERFGIRLDFHAACGETDRFPPAVETAAYRIVQEALTNVVKHARATTVSIVLECYDGSMRIIIEDDGKGFDADLAAGPGSLGLAGMRERLGLLGGTMAIDAAIGTGTTLYIQIPLTPAEGGQRDLP